MSEEREREFIAEVLEAVRRENKRYREQVNLLCDQWKKHIRNEQAEVLQAVHFLRNIAPPSVRDILIAAGWLPPCEGRRAMEGELHLDFLPDDITAVKVLLCKNPTEDERDALFNHVGRRIRLILDPLPEKEGGG